MVYGREYHVGLCIEEIWMSNTYLTTYIYVWHCDKVRVIFIYLSVQIVEQVYLQVYIPV